MTTPASDHETGAHLGRLMFAEADEAWQAHLAEAPEDVGDLLQYFERLRIKATGIDERADQIGASRKGSGVVYRRDAKEAFRQAAEASVKATVAEWRELADRDHEVFDDLDARFIPAASHGLIFPNDPPASTWDARAYEVMHRAFQTVAENIGLDAPDRPAPVREIQPDQPPSHLNRHERRAWRKQQSRRAAA